MIAELIREPLELLASSIDLIGIAILLIAAVRFLINYARFELARFAGLDCVLQIRDMRLRLGSYILLGLEFMIISDVIHASITRTLDDIFILGGLVLVRSALSFFLGVDLRETREENI